MKRFYLAVAMVLNAVAGLPAEASAADLTYPVKAPAPVLYEESPWMLRVRAIAVVPDASATLSAAGAPIAGASVDVSTSVVPEVDVTYFFTKNIALEVVAAFSPHTVTGSGTIAPLGQLAHSVLLPPVATLQYHFTNFGAFRPYIGVGANYTWFLDQSLRQPALLNVHISDSAGIVGNVGFDYMLDKHWGFNVDVKYVDMQPSVSFANGNIVAKVRINPWIVGTGVSYRF